MNSLSVVVPTLNCAGEIAAHVESMKEWLDLASEVVVVDSESHDGTVEYIRSNLPHSSLRILNHPRGLYQSWNHAITQTTGDWIYISTIGDTMEREQLKHMLDSGVALDADVVISQPKFVFSSGIEIDEPVWPIHKIIEFHDIRQPTVIDSMAALVHALRSIPNAIIGSSASNIYRGGHLRDRLFPTCFRMVGDTGWAIRNALETRFCYTNRVGSIFRFHSDIYKNPDYEIIKVLVADLQAEVIAAIQKNKNPSNREFLTTLMEYINFDQRYMHSRTAWGLARRESIIPWYFRPAAIRSRKLRNTLRRDALELPVRLEQAIQKLPLLRLP